MSRLLTKDLLSGLMFIAFGLAALWFGRHLPVGTTVRMGPGYVPHMLAYLMLGLGFIIAIVALVFPSEAVEAPRWKPITLVTAGIAVFALLFELTGMFPALVALVLIASIASDEFKLREVIASIAVLSLLSLTVFKLGLGMNVSMIAGVW
jgi:putative tricarboxylic transport membrane protein